MKLKNGFTSFIILSVLLAFLSADLSSQKRKKFVHKGTPTFKEISDNFYKHWETSQVRRHGRWKQFKRWEWFARTRLDSTGRFNPILFLKGWQEKKLRFNEANKNIVQNVTWTELGPSRLPDQYAGNGYPGMGRLNCLVFHPGNPNIIYVGSASGGLWKTNDDGGTWTSLTDNLPNLGVTSVLIHPTNPDIMYMATGDADGYDTYSFGIMKSLDGGQSWKLTGFSSDVSELLLVAKLKFHPSNPDIIFAAARNGIYKTVNGGATWVLKHEGRFKDIEVHPSDSTLWFATRFSGGIYRSTDSGETWGLVSNGLPVRGFTRIALEFAPSAPHVMYALYVGAADEGFFGLYRSDDTGNTWRLLINSPNLLGWEYDGVDSGGQGEYDLTLGVHPNRPNTVYVGGINLWRSTDGGTTFSLLTHWNAHRAPLVHADQHDFQFHPHNSDIVYMANDGGVFKSDDGGENWRDISSGLAIHQVYRMGSSESDPNRIIIGNQDNGSDLYLNGTWNSVYDADGMDCAVDPVYSNIMYCSIYNGAFFRSTDNARSWTAISGPFTNHGAWVTPLRIDERNPETLYVASNIVYRSDDRGDNWNAISPLLASKNIRALAVSNGGTHIYAANEDQIYITRNSGTSWTTLDSDGEAIPRKIKSIRIDQNNPRKVWVTCGGYDAGKKVYTSSDAGRTWVNISGTLPNVPALHITSDNLSGSLYLGTDLGVFYMSSAKDGWQALANGLPNVIVTELEIHYATGKIRVATYGRGIWEAPLVERPQVFPPLGITGQRQLNRSLMSTEIIDVLNWSHNSQNPQGRVARYRIYRQTDSGYSLIDTVDGNQTQFYVRGAEEKENIYAITAITASGVESSRIRGGVKE